MKTRTHRFLTHGLAATAMALLVTLGSTTQAVARDFDGYRDRDPGHRYSHRIERPNHRARHDRGYRYEHHRRPQHHHRLHLFPDPLTRFGIGLVTGILIGQHD